jgi:hypothetical protein
MNKIQNCHYITRFSHCSHRFQIGSTTTTTAASTLSAPLCSIINTMYNTMIASLQPPCHQPLSPTTATISDITPHNREHRSNNQFTADTRVEEEGKKIERGEERRKDTHEAALHGKSTPFLLLIVPHTADANKGGFIIHPTHRYM